MKPSKKWTISHLASEFEISTRTIRFYEEKRLLAPERTAGGHRIYNKRDRARLKLILRGKRFGYSLEEIMDMLGPADQKKDETEQIKKTLAYGQKSLIEVRERIEELKMLETDIIELSRRLSKRLHEIESDRK